MNIKFIQGTAESVDHNSKTVVYLNEFNSTAKMGYDQLILATGSVLRDSDIPGVQQHTFNIDQLTSAAHFEKHLNALAKRPYSAARNTVVVCGGGFTGIELSTELPARLRAIFKDDREIKVIIIERGAKIGAYYSDALREVIKQACDEYDITWLLNSEIEAISDSGVQLKNGTAIAAATVVWTAGVKANGLNSNIDAERDRYGRFYVDENLQIPGYEGVFATGDMAHAKTDDRGHTALMTCQHAIQLGKFVGYNAAAAAIGIAPLPYRQMNYVTCLDLGAWGAVYTEGWDQQVKMVRQEAKDLKISITHQLIYPPEANREAAFAIADPLADFV